MEDPKIGKVIVILALTGLFAGTSVLSIMIVVPVAEAGDDQTVDIGEMVQFDGSGSQNAAQYWWNFRDNGWCNSTVSPTRTYQTEGVYFVGLLVIASNGQQSLDTVKITVRNDPPVANAGQDVTAHEDETVTFNGDASVDSTVDMPGLTYRWDFGDGYTASGISAIHSYQRVGLYQALLSATDDQGAIGRSIRNVTILNEVPTATVSDVAADEGTAFTILAQGEDTTSDQGSLRYEWDNGKFGEKTDYRYDRPGTCHPLVTVRDDDSATANVAGNVIVQNVAPTTGILAVAAKTNLTVNVTLRASGEKWHDLQLSVYSMADGLMGNASVYRMPGNPNAQEVTIPGLVFNLKGAYQITTCYTPEDDPINGQIPGDTPAWIEFTFEDGSYEVANHDFNVEQQSTWVWEMDPIPYLYGHMISFEGFAFDPGASNLTTTWDFGDGTTLTNHTTIASAPAFVSESLYHSFPSIGTFTVRLIGADEYGGNGEFSVTITIDNQGNVLTGNLAPRVIMKGSLGDTYEDAPACCIASAEDFEIGNLSYQWFFGDGSSSCGQPSSDDNIAFHSYNYSGIFVVTVIARDEQNAIGIAYTEIRVENVDPMAAILGNRIWQEDKIAIFNGSSSYDTPSDLQYLTYAWDFGDGTVAIGENVSHVYRSTGLYSVALAVIDNDGEASSSVIEVEILPPDQPEVRLTDKTIYGPVFALTFCGVGDADASEVFELDYNWDFGDGSPTVTGEDPTHTYSIDGLYQVTLTVTDRYGQTAIANAFVNVAIDSDGDSLTDCQEAGEGTNPNIPDTDGDSIVDYWEIYVYDTSPVESDSDDDGANDWYEAIYFGYNVDTDNDTLMNPWDPDSDNDGVLDGIDIHPLQYDLPNVSAYQFVSTASSGSGVDEGNPLSGINVTVGINFLNVPQLAASSSTDEQADALGIQTARIAADNANPTCAITSPTENPDYQTYFTDLLSIDLMGTASDDIGVTSVTWSNAATVSSGTAIGTTSWSISGIVLIKGINIITVTAGDASGNCGSDTLKVDTEYMKIWIDFHFGRGPRLGLSEGGLLPAFTVTVMDMMGASLGKFDELVEVKYPWSDPIVAQLSSYHLAIYRWNSTRGFEPVRSSTVGDLGSGKVVAHMNINESNNSYHTELYEIVASGLRDPDEDGLTDYREVYQSNWISDPYDRDTDDDGLSDRSEIEDTFTSPTCPDHDSDGLYDGWNDLDKDGEWDSGEPKGEVGYNVDGDMLGGFGTNPRNPDSDGDGLYDGWSDSDFDRQWDIKYEAPGEIGDQTQNCAGGYGTSPTNLDYDNDGVPDGGDLDPLRKLSLFVRINEISLWSDEDTIDGAGDYADYYWTVTVHQLVDPNRQWWDASTKPYAWNSDDISPNQVFEFPYIPDDNYIIGADGNYYDGAYIYVIIELLDFNTDGTIGGTYDIDGTSTIDKVAIMCYDVRHNYWWGDDSHYDGNGYGNLCGHDDGMANDHDCFMSFDIYTNDNDEYPSYEEARYRSYGYDPMNSDSNADYDGDGIPDGYEKKHGIHGLILDLVSDEWSDFDDDGVPNRWEYNLSERGYPKSPDNPSDTLSLELNFSIEASLRTTLGANYSNWLISFENSIRYSNNYLFEAWDGYAVIKSARIFEDGQNFNTADVKIFDTSRTSTFNQIDGCIELARLLDGYWPDNFHYFNALPHELGHFIPMLGELIGLGEEYWDSYGNEITDKTTCLHSIMVDPDLYVEFSTANDYLNPNGLRTDTYQAKLYQHTPSCWETIFTYYNYYSNERGNIMFDLNRDGIIDHNFPFNFIPESIGSRLYDWSSAYTANHLNLIITIGG